MIWTNKKIRDRLMPYIQIVNLSTWILMENSMKGLIKIGDSLELQSVNVINLNVDCLINETF